MKAALVLDDVVIRPETSARYLGVILDKELRWHEHVDQAVAKGTAAVLAIGRLASGKFVLPYKHIRTLYTSVVRPMHEYGLVQWYTPVQTVPDSARRRGSVGFANRLGRVQRMAARLVTGAFKTSLTDAPEYHADLMPMDLQLKVAAFNAALRLASLPPQHPLYASVQKCRTRAPRFFKSPLLKLFIAYPDLRDVETIDCTPRPTTWVPPFTVEIADTSEEASAAVRAIEDGDTLMVYSDGSGEGGWVSAAAIAARPDGHAPLEDRRADVDAEAANPLGGTLPCRDAAGTANVLGGVLSLRARLGPLDEHTVFEGELYDVLLALRIIDALPGVLDAAICLDNQAAIVRAHMPRPKSGQILTDAIHAAFQQIRTARPNFALKLVWVPGHEGVDGNELADLHAKMASAGDDSPDATLDGGALPNSVAALRAAFKKRARAEWQARWAESERGMRYARFDSSPPSACVPRMYHSLKRAQAAVLTQLRTGHIALNQYLHRIKAIDSPLCTRCGEHETVDH